jgi:tetratricopeptide (TPR) repeat protein
LQENIHLLLELCFIRQEFQRAVGYVNTIGEEKCLKFLFTKQSYDNTDAWACYHVGEAYTYMGNPQKSSVWLKQAVKLAPYNLDFRNKLGSALASLNNLKEAENEFAFILSENPRHVSAYTNLGFIKLKMGFPAEALRLYSLALKYDPDYEPLLLNLAGYYAFMRDKTQAVYFLKRILKKNPGNQKAKSALQQINSML